MRALASKAGQHAEENEDAFLHEQISQKRCKKIKLCRQMQLHCQGLWPRLRVGNCLASYLGIAAIDAAHKSARRAQEDIEATGPTFEGERGERKRETDMLTVCVAPGSKNVSFFPGIFEAYQLFVTCFDLCRQCLWACVVERARP